MEINLSQEMVKVVRDILRDTPLSTLRSHVAGREDEYAVNGIEALELFEELYIESLPRKTRRHSAAGGI